MRPSYPEQLNFKGPSGLTAAIEKIARRDHTSISEVLRRGMIAHVRQMGVALEVADNGKACNERAAGVAVMNVLPVSKAP
jgi:hypothetical protein